MKKGISLVALLSLCLALQPTITLSNLHASVQALPDDEYDEGEPDIFESDTCSGVHNYVLPVIGGVFGTVLASGIFVLLELRWHLRE